MVPTTETKMPKPQKDNNKALAAFMAKKAEIDTMLERLATLSADHSTPAQYPSLGPCR